MLQYSVYRAIHPEVHHASEDLSKYNGMNECSRRSKGLRLRLRKQNKYHRYQAEEIISHTANSDK